VICVVNNDLFAPLPYYHRRFPFLAQLIRLLLFVIFFEPFHERKCPASPMAHINVGEFFFVKIAVALGTVILRSHRTIIHNLMPGEKKKMWISRATNLDL